MQWITKEGQNVFFFSRFTEEQFHNLSNILNQKQQFMILPKSSISPLQRFLEL